MKPLPLPVRIAAGLVASAVEQARDLPRLVIEFPVTAVSQALQASMRVQQRVTELAIKGDRALGTLRPVEEKPSWATFDDEEDRPSHNGSRSVTELRSYTRPEPVPSEPAADAASASDAAAAAAAAAAAEQPAETGAPVAELPATEPPRPELAPAETSAVDLLVPVSDDSGPAVLPGYRDMTIPQLRGRLRHLSLEDLRTLLVWEATHDDRPPFVTMLTNRIATVSEE